MLNELVRRGNTVVLTSNQLVDSRAFFSLLNDSVYYQCFKLVRSASAIRLSDMMFKSFRIIRRILNLFNRFSIFALRNTGTMERMETGASSGKKTMNFRNLHIRE